MTAEQNKQIARAFQDAFDREDLEAAGDLLAADCLAYQPGVPHALDKETFKQMGAMFLAAFGQSSHTYEQQVAEGDTVVTRMRWKALHNRGEFYDIPPRGNAFDLEIVVCNRIVNGKIVEHRAIFDAMSFMQQLGALPMPA